MIIQISSDVRHGIQELPVEDIYPQLQGLLNTANTEMKALVECVSRDGFCDVAYESAQESAAELFYFIWSHRDRIKFAVWHGDPDKLTDVPDIYSVTP